VQLTIGNPFGGFAGEVAPDFNEVLVGFRDRLTVRLRFGMSSASAPDHAVHVEFLAATLVERVDSCLKIGAQSTNLQRMLQQLSPDLFLIGFGQRSNLIQGLFKYLNHDVALS
jgi:hypothetical protein